MFDQARRLTDFNPAEFYYRQLLEAGASASTLRDALVSSGLETPERANEIYNQAQLMQTYSEYRTADGCRRCAGGDGLGRGGKGRRQIRIWPDSIREQRLYKVGSR